MKSRWCISILITVALSAVAMESVSIGTASAQAMGEEVLTQGPIHEAFAEVIQLTPQPGIVIPREPPQPIEEMPPDERPAADNVVWIPGYWAWDDDRNDFIWVSGVWRIPPPDRTWVPGYWNRVAQGWQWISGFWAPVQTQEIEYLPPVPESLDTGPNSPSPGNDYIWAAGCWRWNQNRYVWGPGYWGPARPGWVLVPAHYVWTRRGCVFVGEYWDYAPEYRGVLFAPVYFPDRYYARPDFHYRPAVCIDLANLFDNFFCRPQYGHYYFGDYYDPGYARYGIYPWFERNRVHTWYSPFCEYSAWRHEREQPHWLESVRRDFDDRRAHRELRPAHTFQALQTEVRRHPERDRDRLSFAKPLTSYATSSRGAFRFERVNDDVRQKTLEQGRDRHDLASQRARWESDVAKPGKEFKPSKVRLPRTATADVLSPSGAQKPGLGGQPLPGASFDKGKRGKGENSQPSKAWTRTEVNSPETKGKASGNHDEKPKGIDSEKYRGAWPPADGTPQKKSRNEGGFTPEGPPSGKHDNDRETKSRQAHPPLRLGPESAPPPKSHREDGFTPGGPPSGKHDSDRSTKGHQDQPPPPPDQTDSKYKGDSKGKHRGESND